MQGNIDRSTRVQSHIDECNEKMLTVRYAYVQAVTYRIHATYFTSTLVIPGSNFVHNLRSLKWFIVFANKKASIIHVKHIYLYPLLFLLPLLPGVGPLATNYGLVKEIRWLTDKPFGISQTSHLIVVQPNAFTHHTTCEIIDTYTYPHILCRPCQYLVSN